MRGGMWLASALAAVLIVAVPLLGWWALAGAAFWLILAVWGSRRSGRWWPLAPTLGLGGGAAGAASALGALLRHAGEPQYAVRAGFGWLALALALVAVAGGVLLVARPRLGAVLLCLGSLLGFLAINLYDINTFYLVAPLGGLCGALPDIAGPRVAARAGRRAVQPRGLARITRAVGGLSGAAAPDRVGGGAVAAIEKRFVARRIT